MNQAFARVALPRPVEETFHYRIPENLAGQIFPGTVVHVPFGRQTMTGVVTELLDSSPVKTRAIVSIAHISPVPGPLLELSLWAALYYLSPVGLLLRLALPPARTGGRGPKFVLTDKGRASLDAGPSSSTELLEALKRGPRTAAYLSDRFDPSLMEAATAGGLIVPAEPARKEHRAPSAGYRRDEKQVQNLTIHQEDALSGMTKAVDEARFTVTLMRGVTGSGKTEVYLRAARHTLDRGKGVLLLVPEISLTPLLVSRLERVAPGQVAALHSGMKGSEREASWEAVQRGKARLVVGVRSGVFAPVPDLGLIIVDEEHDPSFRQEDTPSYSARDVAVKRGQIEGVPVVLGSATPSFESWHNTVTGKYEIAVLPERVTPSPDPELVVVDMSQPDQQDPKDPSLSKTLLTEIEGVIVRGEQAMLFLNRRGFAPFLLCTECQEAMPCPNCSVTLTYHSGPAVVCHYCGHKQKPPDSCPRCSSTALEPVGAGTQKVEKVLMERFPSASVDRLDRDALGKPGALEAIYDRMDSGETDILVGTQMLAKGHDFPRVTLAGILSAEQALDIPDFRSAERTFQIITQVSGRAGRGEKRGKVVVQTYTPNHYAVTSALGGDYDAFFESEKLLRRQLGYPPFGRLGRIVVDGISEEKVSRAAASISRSLKVGPDARILGPSPAPISRIRNRHRWHLLVLAQSHGELIRVLSSARREQPAGVRVNVRVDPIQLL
ncbi:MAG: primosomal protein N' [bacterium]|nr:primosomal protein N' [bacterium]MDT8396630.1 primosomal protein N' [bacterium]